MTSTLQPERLSPSVAEVVRGVFQRPDVDERANRKIIWKTISAHFPPVQVEET